MSDVQVTEPGVIPPIGTLDNAMLPVVIHPIPKPEGPISPGHFFDASAGLDRLTMKALRKAEEILDLELTKGDEDFTAVLRAQVAQVQTILTTQVRVDEGRLKKKQADKMGELLEAIREAEIKTIN